MQAGKESLFKRSCPSEMNPGTLTPEGGPSRPRTRWLKKIKRGQEKQKKDSRRRTSPAWRIQSKKPGGHEQKGVATRHPSNLRKTRHYSVLVVGVGGGGLGDAGYEREVCVCGLYQLKRTFRQKNGGNGGAKGVFCLHHWAGTCPLKKNKPVAAKGRSKKQKERKHD